MFYPKKFEVRKYKKKEYVIHDTKFKKKKIIKLKRQKNMLEFNVFD